MYPAIAWSIPIFKIRIPHSISYAPFRSKGHFGFRRYSNSVIIDVSFLHAKEMHLFLVHFFKGGRFQDFGFKEEYESKSQRLLEHEYIHVYLVHIGDYP